VGILDGKLLFRYLGSAQAVQRGRYDCRDLGGEAEFAA